MFAKDFITYFIIQCISLSKIRVRNCYFYNHVLFFSYNEEENININIKFILITTFMVIYILYIIDGDSPIMLINFFL